MDSGWKHAVPVAVSGALLTNTKMVVVGLWEVDDMRNTHHRSNFTACLYQKTGKKKLFVSCNFEAYSVKLTLLYKNESSEIFCLISSFCYTM